MQRFTKDYNCCKTVGCENFGVSQSASYITQSERLGYLSIECKLCGSNPPLINNELVASILSEKLDRQFGQKVVGCHKCSPYFFITPTPISKLHGFTSAGTQRKKCSQCSSVFTLPDYKNVEALKQVLASILLQKDIKTAIKECGLSARLYYFYLRKLALILSNFSRLQEGGVLQREHLAMHSEGRLVKLNHQRGLYMIFTAEIESGYLLLQTNNLTQVPLSESSIYHEKETTLATNVNSDNLETVLLKRYESNLKRKHFEQLIVGNINPISKCGSIYPDKVAYAHFQLLKIFTENVNLYDHYIEHESTLRSAALMSSLNSIKAKTANVYYFLPFMQGGKPLDGKPLGWWNDIWFSNNVGAFCPITTKLQKRESINVYSGDSIENFYRYFDGHLNKNVNSMQVIDDLSEIFRVIYNYCEEGNKKTPACLFGAADKKYLPEQLLDAALHRIMTE